MKPEQRHALAWSLVVPALSFAATATIEPVLRTGNTWLMGVLALYGRNILATLVVTVFYAGFVGVDYIAFRNLRGTRARAIVLSVLGLLQGAALVVVMPN